MGGTLNRTPRFIGEKKTNQEVVGSVIGCGQDPSDGLVGPGYGSRGGPSAGSTWRKLAAGGGEWCRAGISGLMATVGASGSDGKGPGVETPVTYYRLEEVAERNSSKEIWLVIHGRVYDITRFLNEVGPGRREGPWSCGVRGGRARKGRQGCVSEGMDVRLRAVKRLPGASTL